MSASEGLAPSYPENHPATLFERAGILGRHVLQLLAVPLREAYAITRANTDTMHAHDQSDRTIHPGILEPTAKTVLPQDEQGRALSADEIARRQVQKICGNASDAYFRDVGRG